MDIDSLRCYVDGIEAAAEKVKEVVDKQLLRIEDVVFDLKQELDKLEEKGR